MLKFLRFSASRYLVLVPALFGFLITSSSAEADAFGVWEFSKSCLANEGGSVELVQDGFKLTGADGGTCAGKSHWVKLEAVIPEGTTQLGFLWTYQTNDGAHYDPPQIVRNGVITQLTNQSYATGSAIIPVEAGDTFAFRQYSTDSCCQPGNLTITNLTLGLGEWVSTTSPTTTTMTSTTTVPSSTVPATVPTTTTVQETTTTTSTSTTSSLPQTTVPTTTTEPPQTTTTLQQTPSSVTSTSSTTTSTSTTVAPTTTTTVYVPSATTTTELIVEPATTTTTTEPTPAPTTTAKHQSETTTTTSTTSSLPPVTTTQPDVTTTILSPTDEPEPLTQTELLNTIEALSEATPEAIEAIVETVLTKELDTSQATLLITTPAVLENITPTQAEQLFEQITPTELSPDEAEAVVEAVQEAPNSVRKAFEAVLNIFQGFADSYVPLNSTVPVKTRRALIALGAVFLTVAPAPVRRIR